MDNEKDMIDLDLDELMEEFHQAAIGSNSPKKSEEPAAAEEIPLSEDEVLLTPDAAEAAAFFSELAMDPIPASVSDVSEEAKADPLPTMAFVIPEAPAEEAAAKEVPQEPTQQVPPVVEAPKQNDANQEPTIRVPGAKPAQSKEDAQQSRISRLRELKKKIVAGPEKKYYTLNGIGVGRLQLAILANLIILVLCCTAIGLFTLDKVPENRMKLMVFSQVLALLGSGLLGCTLMLDGLGDLFHLRYSLNSTLAVSFCACCADAWFALNEERIPCSSVFVLEMTLALLSSYYKRNTEMSQMDTLRKATNLTGLSKEANYYEKRTGILRGPGDVEDFMDTYARPSGPEIVQRVYAFVALIASIGIGVLAWLLHNESMAVQIFAITLSVSAPAGYFISLTRPAALLEKRLHMVGTVICGWQGVKKLCGRAVFPLRDKDLFPRGSTKLNGIKFYSERVPAEIVSYTCSLIFAAGGGLVPLFRNLLASRSGIEYPVENFRDYGTGGIGGEVNGQPVVVGTYEFMQDMGVEVPKGTMVNQAIYVGIDGELAAVIAITYSKMRSAAAGLVSLCGSWRLKPLLLAGDFMLTDSFIRSKFSIRTRKLIMPTKEIRAQLSEKKPNPEADVLALVTRDDLVASVYAVTGSMTLRTSCWISSFISVLGGIIGIAIMLALAYLGNIELITPLRALLFQCIWLVPTWLATEWARVV